MLEQFNARKGPQAWGFAQLGRAREQLGENAAAEQLDRDALKLDPHFAVAHHWLGLLLARQGRDAEARERIAEYERLRKLQDTEYELNMALLRNADSPNILMRLAKTRFDLGRTKEALVTLDRARQLSPDNPELNRLRQEWIQRTNTP